MLQTFRHEEILKYLSRNDFISVNKAVEILDASAPTIRRDFNSLARRQLAERFRGGLRLAKKAPDQMMPFDIRQLQQSAEKEAIAREAVKLINPGDVILIDGGTTTFHLGMCLPNIELRAITNSLRLATMLEEKSEEYSKLEISLTGGLLYKRSGILLGPNTQTGIAQYHADLAFLSAGGIDETGIYNTNELVTETERVMIRNADKVAILADQSKIGKKSMCRVCGLDEIDILITNDWSANNDVLAKFENAGIKVVRATVTKD